MSKQVRSLGLLEATAIGLGTMIAAGIFSLSGLAVSEIGGSAILSFVIAALIGGTTAAAYSEFASVYSESGGGYLFSSRTFNNDYLIYVEGLMLFMGYSATTAFYLATMGEWVHEFIYPIAPWIPGVITALALGFLNARGTEESGAFQVIVTALKVVVLLVFIGGAFVFKPPSETVSTFVTSLSGDVFGIVKIAALAFITFFGFSAIAASAGEIKEPRKTVPLSIAISMVTVTILYAMVIVAMVNSPIPADVVAEQGETAMGAVAEAFLGQYGMWLIVAGAIFSMVSASNASILAASRIGYLMGKEGRFFSQFQYVSRKYGTPFWSVTACTALIITLITVFVGVFPAHGETPFDIHLGLSALTGFANTNLLIPLSVVNVALIYSRRRFKDMERPFSVPLVPIIPIVGVIANLALILNLPMIGVGVGAGVIALAFIAYLMFGADKTPTSEHIETTHEALEVYDTNPETKVLLPIARVEDVKPQLNLLDTVYSPEDTDESVECHIMYVEQTPEQLPTDTTDNEELNETLDNIRTEVEEFDPETPISVDGYRSISVSEAILHITRVNTVDSILMGYPETSPKVTDIVQHKAPCPVIFTHNVTGDTDFSTVNIGVGEGPNHKKALDIISQLPTTVKMHVTRVNPTVEGTPETLESTLENLGKWEDIEIHDIEDRSVARGLIKKSDELDATLVMGASRDSWLRQTLFGSTPDKAVELSTEYNQVPVVIVSSRESVMTQIGNAVFTLKRLAWSFF